MEEEIFLLCLSEANWLQNILRGSQMICDAAKPVTFLCASRVLGTI